MFPRHLPNAVGQAMGLWIGHCRFELFDDLSSAISRSISSILREGNRRLRWPAWHSHSAAGFVGSGTAACASIGVPAATRPVRVAPLREADVTLRSPW